MKVTHLLLEIIKKKVYFALYLASTSSCGSHSGEWRLQHLGHGFNSQGMH